MNFFSPEFFIFFIIVLIAYYSIPAKHQNLLLFIASSVFVGLLSVKFLCFTYLFIIFTYTTARLLDHYNNEKTRKWIFNIAVAIIIGALLMFKYTNMLIDAVDLLINILGGRDEIHLKNLVIPIGISYYTFQALGYLLQIYRKIENTEHNILIFSNYFLFFPKFLSGPIEMSKSFIPQLQKEHCFDKTDFTEGLRLMLWGAFKKIVIADRLALIVNNTYGNIDNSTFGIILVTLIVQPFHIYCDFSGYTDIAMGIGRAFGLKLTNNFNRPFFSTSVTVFWQRWHISLSSWCNEFIFKRLAFKHRKWKKFAGAYAVFITFLIIGIWHGSKWNFLILGVLQGIALCYEYFTKKWRTRTLSYAPRTIFKYFRMIWVYFFFGISLVFFNAATFKDAIQFITGLFINIDFSTISAPALSFTDKIITLLAISIIVFLEIMQEKGKDAFRLLDKWPMGIRWSIYYILLLTIVYLGSPTSDFVYMQF